MSLCWFCSHLFVRFVTYNMLEMPLWLYSSFCEITSLIATISNGMFNRMGYGLGGQCPLPDFEIWHFPIKFLAKTGCFLNFEWVKLNFATFDPSLQKSFLLIFWWRKLAAGRNLSVASCRGGWGERSSPRRATAIHTVSVDRPPNLPIERRTLYPWAIADNLKLRRQPWPTSAHQRHQVVHCIMFHLETK